MESQERGRSHNVIIDDEGNRLLCILRKWDCLLTPHGPGNGILRLSGGGHLKEVLGLRIALVQAAHHAIQQQPACKNKMSLTLITVRSC